MLQPSRKMITHKLLKVIYGELSREEVSDWAFKYIENDNEVEVTDIDAWHYLVSVSCIAEMIPPGIYLYSIEDIKTWLQID